jgi:uncharacterized protein (DUF58 family)
MIPSTRLLWLVAAMFPLAALAGLSTPLVPAAVAIGIAVVIATASDAWISRRRLDGVRARPTGSLRLHKDRPAEVQLVCESGAAPVAFRMGLAWPPEFETDTEILPVNIAVPGAVAVAWNVTPRRRGRFTLSHAYLGGASALGLWEVRRACPLDAALRVYPNLQGRDEMLAIRRQAAGEHARRMLGRGREFEHLREYVPGDGFDEIDWKATARRGKPITRVFQVERTQEIYAVIDSSRLTGRSIGADIRLERYIQAALALGAAAQRHGDLFGVATFHDRLLDFVRAGKGSAQAALCRQALYRLQPSPVAADFEDVAAQLRLQLRARALVIFLTDLDEPSAADGFAAAAKLLTRKHLVAAVTIRPEAVEPLFTRAASSLDDVYGQIGGHLRWKGLKETEAALRRAGVHFRLVEQPTLSRQLAGLYDEIKQRQLL